MTTDLADGGQGAAPRLAAGKGFAAVMAGAAVCGFCAGALGQPAWQVAVETAQVLGGAVSYPPGNPFGLYHAKLWTLSHQVLAPLLAAGVTERTLSILLSGALGAVAFMAFAAMAFALSGDWLAGAGAPLVVYYAGAAANGVVYPVLTLGTSHTYGSLGLSFAMLAVGALGAGRTRSGAFLLGLAPAAHPSVGAWVFLAVCLAVAAGRDRARTFRRGAPWLAAGACVAALSLGVHLLAAPAPPVVDAAMEARCLRAFEANWDAHRAPAPVLTRGGGLNAACVAVCLCWLFRGRERLSGAVALLLRTLVAAAAVGAAGAVVSWLPPGLAPRVLTTLMPARMLNAAAFSFMALAVGLLGAERSPLWLAGWLAAALLVLRQTGPSGVAWAMMAAAPVLCWRARAAARPERAGVPAGGRAALARLALAALLCFVLAQSARKAWRLGAEAWPALCDRTNDAFFAAAAQGCGMVAPGPGVWLAQLRTRRPMLLDACALDILPYAPAGGPEMERILRGVYGVSLFSPPPGMRPAAVIPEQPTRALWESRRPEEWRRVAEAFGFTAVMTLAGWRLNLPVTASGGGFTLYAIPPRAAESARP
ncbi:MAG TPA: hypothetical protein P5137_03095 [Candidatus Brocadiia bacterium]|nr:hypothetical protein [Candidatus Brocadiia bacterium]